MKKHHVGEMPRHCEHLAEGFCLLCKKAKKGIIVYPQTKEAPERKIIDDTEKTPNDEVGFSFESIDEEDYVEYTKTEEFKDETEPTKETPDE